MLACAAVLAIWTTITLAEARKDPNLAAALRVAAGLDRAQATFKTCVRLFRDAGFDPRFFVTFWYKGRFEVFEGVRLTLRGADVRKIPNDAQFLEKSTNANNIESPTQTTRARCEALVRNDVPGKRGIEGVSAEDLQLMRDVYASSNPDPHVARDQSLYNDCMKANFNARQLDYDSARRRCDCTLEALHSIPSDQLDSWLARAHSGAKEPMQQQPWFGAFAPKLQTCLALK